MTVDLTPEELNLLLLVLSYPQFREGTHTRKLADQLLDKLEIGNPTAVPEAPPVAYPDLPEMPALPADSEMLRITPLGFSNAKGRLSISYHPPEGGARQVSCWKPELFDQIRARLNKPTTFYVVRKGQYLNIIGVK